MMLHRELPPGRMWRTLFAADTATVAAFECSCMKQESELVE